MLFRVKNITGLNKFYASCNLQVQCLIPTEITAVPTKISLNQYELLIVFC